MATVFIHIPKTAGTTLTELLLKNYQRKKLLHLPQAGQLQASELSRKAFENDCIHGHFRYHDELRIPENFLFTFFRNPLERCLSNFFHFRREGEWGNASLLESAEHFLSDEGLKKNGNWNLQTYFLAWTRGKPFFRNEEDYHLRLAQERLRQLDLVGITEHFEESVYQLAQSLAWKKWYYIPHNEGSYSIEKQQVLNHFRKELVAANELDLELYESALEIYGQQKKEIRVPAGKIWKARLLGKLKKSLR